jgi:HSP20 family protein
MERWDPLKDIFLLRERVNRFFEDVSPSSGVAEPSVWTPLVDIYETPEAFIVKAELPGVGEADIEVRIEDQAFSFSGERKPLREGRSYHQIERCCGAFSRSFVLPVRVDKNDIKATLKDGILNIVLSKSAEAVPRHIEIKEQGD